MHEAAEGAASLILDGHLDGWVEGAIFPREMAFFLASCEVEGVECVIESGRQDGYSTAILADWASRTGRRVVSIDLETDRARAESCRARLSRWSEADLVRGSAYTEFGRKAAEHRAERTAFIVDGPKGWPAISMICGALHDNVALLSLHNLAEGFDTRAFFEDIGGPEIFYEWALPDPPPAWQELEAREKAQLSAQGAARSLELSSLGVLRLDDARRARLRSLRGSQFGLHQPEIVRGFYKAGAYGPATKLYGLSYRLLGR
ncbi:hypothetical protein CLD20_13275 [Afifella sp. IM 167]|nr:hypothetical protein [Afifella sp. IM 167]